MSVIITLYNADGTTDQSTHDFHISIECRHHRPCHLWSKRDWYLPPTLELVEPTCSEYYEGDFDEDSSWEEVWLVPFKFYRLTKIKMWLWSESTSGFEVTYNVPNDDKF